MWKLALLSMLVLSLAQEDDIPKGKEYDDTIVLDLSNREITSLSGYDFSNYPQLEEVNLSKNNIRKIEEDAFIHCLNLKKLNLSGNPNLLIPEFSAFIISQSLTHLDLSNCNLKQLPPTTFHGTVYLEEIDLSGNPLIDNAIDVMSISSLHHPKKIILPYVDEDLIRAICEEVDILIDIKSKDYQDSVACVDVRQGTWQPKEAEHPPVSIEKRQTEEEDSAHEGHEEGNEQAEKPEEKTNGEETAAETNNENTNAEPEAAKPEGETGNAETGVKVEPKEETNAEGEAQPDETKSESETNAETDETKVEVAIAEKEIKPDEQTEGQTKVQPGEETNGETDSKPPDNKDVAVPSIETHDNENKTEKAHIEQPAVHAEDTTVQGNDTAAHAEDTAAPPVNIKSNDTPEPNEKKDDLSAPSSMQRGIIPGNSEKAEKAENVTENQESSTGSNVLVFLVVAVVVAGIAAFGYKFYKSRKYQAASQSEPIERELKEIVTDRQAPREEQPLVNRQTNSVEIKEVDENSETPKDNGNINANPSGNSNPSGHLTNPGGNSNNTSGYIPHAAVTQEPGKDSSKPEI